MCAADDEKKLTLRWLGGFFTFSGGVAITAGNTHERTDGSRS